MELIKRIAETESPSTIEAIKQVFQSEKKEWWNELGDEQKEAIAEGERQIENGEFVTFEKMMTLFK